MREFDDSAALGQGTQLNFRDTLERRRAYSERQLWLPRGEGSLEDAVDTLGVVLVGHPSLEERVCAVSRAKRAQDRDQPTTIRVDERLVVDHVKTRIVHPFSTAGALGAILGPLSWKLRHPTSAGNQLSKKPRYDWRSHRALAACFRAPFASRPYSRRITRLD
jgi:hypothetical protein